MILLQFHTKDDKKKIHITDKIYYYIEDKQKFDTITSFIIDSYSHSSTYISKRLNQKAENRRKSMLDALKFSMYFVGSIDLLNTYCYESISPYTTFSLFADSFGKEVIDLYRYIRSIQDINIKNLEPINDYILKLVDSAGLF